MDKSQTASTEIRIYYNPENATHKKTVAQAEGSGKAVSSFAYSEAPTAYNVWMTIFEGLTKDDKENFFDRNDERYENLISGKDYSFEDWRKVCLHNTDLIMYPVAISGEKIILIRRPSEVSRLQELDFTKNRKERQ
ncbi:MAG: arsenate reductase family protein [Saprospiraceae bacterium]